MTSRSVRFLAVLLASAVLVQAAWADDLLPPPWRGQPGTTMGMWEFYTPASPVGPDVGVNPYGSSSLIANPGVGQIWYPTWGGRDGVWPLSGEIEVTIDNRPEPLPYKDIWVQLTWAQQVPDVFPIVKEKNSDTLATIVQEVPLGPTGEPYGDGIWYHTVYQIHIEPNPDWEIVRIDGAIMVDELVIDTICAPEPASLALLALGGVALLRRSRSV